MQSITREKMLDLIEQFSRQAREYHRRGDVVLRNQAENSIREIAPNAEYAAKVIREIREQKQAGV